MWSGLSKRWKPTNTLVYISSLGNIVSSYDKIHSFSFSNEKKVFCIWRQTFNKQNRRVYYKFYYLLQLEVPRVIKQALQEYNLIINISNWTKHRVLHLQILLQARVVEN